MKSFNKKHKVKHTTKVKFKKYEWSIKTGYQAEQLQVKRVNFIPKDTIKEYSVKLNSVIEYPCHWNKKEFLVH